MQQLLRVGGAAGKGEETCVREGGVGMDGRRERVLRVERGPGGYVTVYGVPRCGSAKCRRDALINDLTCTPAAIPNC